MMYTKTLNGMSPEERDKYLNGSDLGFGPRYFEDEILEGKIHISEIPFEYRVDGNTPYIYACRSVRGLIDPDHFTEKKLLEMTMLSDIMEARRRGMLEEVKMLMDLHWSYFAPEGVYNPECIA